MDKTADFRRKKTWNLSISGLFGGDKRDRTADLLNAINRFLLDNYTPPEPPPHFSREVRYSVTPSSAKFSDTPDASPEKVESPRENTKYSLKETKAANDSQTRKSPDLTDVRYSVGPVESFDDYVDNFASFPFDELKRLTNRPAKEIEADLDAAL